MTEIYLVRHGETEWNRAARYQGRLNSPLTAKGVRQAHQLGKRLAQHANELQAAYVSPLGRAKQTHQILASYIGPIPVHCDERLCEVSIGSWDGLTLSDIDAGWPGSLDGSTQFDWYFRSPDGESYQAAKERVRGWLADVTGTILVVSHGLLGRIIRGAYLGLPRAEALRSPVPQDVICLLADGNISRLDHD